MNVSPGQVWIETVTPTIGAPEPWQRLHFVTGVKPWYVAGHRKEYVLSRSRDDTHQTELKDFLGFSFLGFSIDVSVPCVEQLSLAELDQMSKGSYSHPSGAGLVDTVYRLIETLDVVSQVGGFKRHQQIQRAIVELRNVAKFLGEDTKKLDQEIWVRGID